jgi:hypothetical protein
MILINLGFTQARSPWGLLTHNKIKDQKHFKDGFNIKYQIVLQYRQSRISRLQVDGLWLWRWRNWCGYGDGGGSVMDLLLRCDVLSKTLILSFLRRLGGSNYIGVLMCGHYPSGTWHSPTSSGQTAAHLERRSARRSKTWVVRWLDGKWWILEAQDEEMFKYGKIR